MINQNYKSEEISMRSQQKQKCEKKEIIGAILYCVFGISFLITSILKVRYVKFLKVIPTKILLTQLFPFRHIPHIKRIMIGLILGAIGDLILEYLNDSFFVLGASFFLAGHVAYIFAFLNILEGKDYQILFKRKIATLFCPILILSIATINLATVISDKLKEDGYLMVIMLPIYLIFLSFMVISSLLVLLSSKKPDKNEILLLVGTISFFISDNVLGLCKFTDYNIFGLQQLNNVVIMVTYYIGQYFIAMSCKKIEVNIRPISLISNESDF